MFDSTYLETFRKPDSGFSLSGSGSFSSVFLSPCGEYAVKSSNYGYADGWVLYAAALLAQGDILPEWAPRIYHMQFSRSGGTYVSLMEAYEKTDAEGLWGMEVRDLWEGYNLGKEPVENMGEFEECLENMNSCANYRECLSFLYYIEKETGIPLFYDLMGNVMWDWRTDSEIFTDPVCFLNWNAYKKGTVERKADIWAFLERCATKTDKIRLVY